MTSTITPDRTPPTRITVSGDLDLRAALDLADLLDLTAPAPVEIDVADVGRLRADGLAVVAGSVRRARQLDRRLVVVHAAPLVDLLLTIVGITDGSERHRSREVAAA